MPRPSLQENPELAAEIDARIRGSFGLPVNFELAESAKAASTEQAADAAVKSDVKAASIDAELDEAA